MDFQVDFTAVGFVALEAVVLLSLVEVGAGVTDETEFVREWTQTEVAAVDVSCWRKAKG